MVFLIVVLSENLSLCTHTSWLTIIAPMWGSWRAVCHGSICEVRSVSAGSMRMGGDKKADLWTKKKVGGGMKLNSE